MTVKLLTKHHLEFLSLKGGYAGSSESTHVKMPHCWKSHALAPMMSFESGPENEISVLNALSNSKCVDSPEPIQLVYTKLGCG